MQNDDFICEICGKRDYVPSELAISANYGSVHDGEQLTLDICGECADAVFNLILKRAEKQQRREKSQSKVLLFPTVRNNDGRNEDNVKNIRLQAQPDVQLFD